MLFLGRPPPRCEWFWAGAAQVVGVLGRSDREMVVLEQGDPGVAMLGQRGLEVEVPEERDREVAVRGQGDLEPVARTWENPAPADRETRARMVENRAGITLAMEIPLRGRPDSRRGPAAWI
jgi:hypothetical protein